MEDVIKSIKKKLSTDNLVEMMKDAKVIDNQNIKEEDVRKTLEKIDPNNLIDIDELAAKLNEITEEASKDKAAKAKNSGIFSVLSKTVRGKTSKAAEEEEYGVEDNITGFLD